MKILYDHQIFSSQKYGGISRYFYEIVREFHDMQDVQCKIPLLVSNNHYISDKQFISYVNLLSNKQFRGKQRIFNYLNKPNTILKLKQQKFDVFHPTYYDPYFLDYVGKKPFVLTVHDMIHEKFSEMFSPADKTTEQKKLLAEKATKIIAISESTKKDLIELFGTDESKIEIIYHGNSMHPKENIKIDISLPEKYILFVGSRGGYKNFDKFLKAVSPLIQRDKSLSLICAGGGSFKTSELKLYEDWNIKEQIYQYDIDDNVLAYLYQNAIAFIFPSLYEGFGIPILEAFACGCPLLCSNTSSFPEIAGNGALYFDPYSEESIRSTISQAIDSSELRNSLVMLGKEQLKEFSWQKTAQKTKEIYKTVMQ